MYSQLSLEYPIKKKLILNQSKSDEHLIDQLYCSISNHAEKAL